jgi:hypothetical protein
MVSPKGKTKRINPQAMVNRMASPKGQTGRKERLERERCKGLLAKCYGKGERCKDGSREFRLG